MRPIQLISTFVFCVASLAPCARAQTHSFVIPHGNVPGAQGTSPMDQEQMLLLQVPQKIMNHDLKGAEEIYSQVIALNGGNADAYIERGMLRRELGDEPGAMQDARTAVALINGALQTSPRDPNLYHQRAMGLRLLKQFGPAKRDLQTAMDLGGNLAWDTDLKAIELEEKMAQ